MYRQDGGGIGAIVKVANVHEAQIAISQLHKRKVGTKRISISQLPVDGGNLPKKEVVALLQSVPGAKVQLFKFRQMFEERFRGSIIVAELHKMKDVVNLTEDLIGVGRMVQLNTSEVVSNEEVEMLYCEVHDAASSQMGWSTGRVCEWYLWLARFGAENWYKRNSDHKKAKI